MSLFKEFLDAVKPSSEVEKIKMLCDKIQLEEIPNFKKDSLGENQPKGVNVFLTLPLKNNRFICLEREFKDQFVIKVMHGRLLEGSYTVGDTRAEKILQKFAEIFKHENGE